MTLEEAIKHCKEKAEELNQRAESAENNGQYKFSDECKECANEHEQLAKWLEDYKRLLGEKSYAMGYQDGLEDGLNDIRPHGEWVLIDDVNDPDDRLNRHKCSECGRIIVVYTWQTLADYPFCHCGADMRGGAE